MKKRVGCSEKFSIDLESFICKKVQHDPVDLCKKLQTISVFEKVLQEDGFLGEKPTSFGEKQGVMGLLFICIILKNSTRFPNCQISQQGGFLKNRSTMKLHPLSSEKVDFESRLSWGLIF